MHPFIPLLARITVGLVWLVASFSKLSQKGPRGAAVAQFGIIPERLAEPIGWALPFVELGTGALLIAGQWTAWAALASLVLLALFTIAIAVNLLQGNRVECNCFGQLGRSRISWWSVGRNLSLLAASAVVLLAGSSYLSVDGWLAGTALRPGDPPVVEFVPALLLALTAALFGMLLSASWHVMRILAKTDDGPALGLPERRVLRRWMRLEVHPTTASQNGR